MMFSDWLTKGHVFLLLSIILDTARIKLSVQPLLKFTLEIDKIKLQESKRLFEVFSLYIEINA